MKILLASCTEELDEKIYSDHDCYFIDLIKDKKTHEFIIKTKGKEINISTKLQDKKYVQILVDEYLAFMGRLSKKYNNIFWWSTFTSSKNRFMTDTFAELCNFYAVIEELESHKYNNLTIIASPGILKSICEYLKKKGIDYEQKNKSVVHLKKRIKYFYTTFKNTTIFVLLTWYRIFICDLMVGNKIKSKLKNSQENPYVIRTWIYERSFPQNLEYKDSFFGKLPEYISEKKPLYIIGGLIGNYLNICKKIKDCESFVVIPQEFFLKYKSPLKTIYTIRKNRIQFNKNSFFSGEDVSEIINYELYKEYSDRNVLESFQFSYFIENMLKQISPRDFLTTYENNPWEKICIIKLRELSKNTRIFGYQHSVLSKYSLNMFFEKNDLSFIPTPDKVITVGNITRDILIEIGGYDKKKVFSGCGLRFMHLFDIPRRKDLRGCKTILITPEGIPGESIKICNFVYAALKDMKDLKVIIRAHPALPFKKFSHNLNFKMESVPHFEISDKASVMEDLNRSDIVVYRGSTLALEAVKTGLSVIYLDLGDLISVDPLFGLSALKWTVNTPDEVKDAVNLIYSMKDEDYLNKSIEASEYVDNYFHPVTKEKTDIFIE